MAAHFLKIVSAVVVQLSILNLPRDKRINDVFDLS
jgi:hypothetical protein